MSEDFEMEESETMEEDGNVSLTEEQLLRLRHDDPTQYSTLVKMHLSFTTDLPTVCDGVDGRRSGGSTSSTSWRQLAPLMRWLGGGGGKRAPSPCEEEGDSLTPQLLQQLQQIIRFLGVYNTVITEGLFRKCGSSSRQAELRQQLLHQSPAALAAALASCSPHDVASLLKGLLADLPEPLLQDHNFALHCKLAELGNNENGSSAPSPAPTTVNKSHCRRVKALQLLLLLLPPRHLQLLRPLLQLLHTVAAHKHLNRMTDANLGMVFAPHILCPRKLSGSELQQHSAVAGNAVAFMVKHAPKLFQVPVELECDVKQYWTNRAEAAMRQQLQQSMCCASFLQQHDSLDTTSTNTQQDDTTSITTSASSSLHPFDASTCHPPHDSTTSCHPSHDCSSVSSYCGGAVALPAPCFSPDHDPTLAHTVFSFVDRTQTQAASARETTALALAELYAHVNSLPDSDKKRRLVKQFNAASGHGTPSYGSQGGGAATSRAAAFANSIKKHLLRAGSRRDGGCGAGLQKAAAAGGHLQGKKSGSYSPRRAFQQSLHQGGSSLRYHPGTPNTSSGHCPHGNTPKTPATPHPHHPQQHSRAKSWDNLTTPKNLRKCLFPSSPSPFMLRKKSNASKEVHSSSVDVPCSAKGSKSCTALCSRCSQRPLLNNFATTNDKASQTSASDKTLQTSAYDRSLQTSVSDKASQTLASEKAVQTLASEKAVHTSACDRTLQTSASDKASQTAVDDLSRYDSTRSSVTEGPLGQSFSYSMHCPKATTERVPSVAVSPAVGDVMTVSASMVPVAGQGPESDRPSLWRTNDPSLSSLCKRAEELIDISRSRTLQARVPVPLNNYDAINRPSHYTSTADSAVTPSAHGRGYSIDDGLNSCSYTQVSNLSTGMEGNKDITPPCPSLPRTSTFNPCKDDASFSKDVGCAHHSNVTLEGTPLPCHASACPNAACNNVIPEDSNIRHIQESRPPSVHGSNSISTTPVAVLKLGVYHGLANGVVPVSAHTLAQSPGSPLTNAVLHDSISQALVLTPRSRCPIVATRNGGRGGAATPSSTVAALARHNLSSSAHRYSIASAAASIGCGPQDVCGAEQRHQWQHQAIGREVIEETVTVGDTTVDLEASAVGAVVTGDGCLRDSKYSATSKCPKSGSTDNVVPTINIHCPSQHSEAHAGGCHRDSVNTEQLTAEGSKPCTLVRRKSTLSRKNASDSDILEISRKSSFRKEDPKKSSSTKNVSSLGKAVRRSLSRRLSKSWRRSTKAGGLLSRQGGSSMLYSDQDTVDSGFDASNALLGSDDASSRGDIPSDLSSQDIDLESSGGYYSSQRAHGRSATGSESELVPDFNRMREEQTMFRLSTERSGVYSPLGNEPLGYLTKSLSPFSNTPPPGVKDSRYSSSTSEALGSFFKHLSSSSLAEIAKRLKTYNDPALLNSSYRMLSPIESDTSSGSLPSTPVKEHDESLSLVFREYLESRALVTGQEGSEFDGSSSVAGEGLCEEKSRSDPLFESCSVVSSSTSGRCSCSGAICSGGRSVSCGAINSLALSLPTHPRDQLMIETPLESVLSHTEGVAVNGSLLENTGQEEEITESFHSVGGEFSESLLRCLDGQNPLSVSCDATSGTWDAAADLVGEGLPSTNAAKVGVSEGNRATSYRSAVDLGELLSINRLCVKIPEANCFALDLDAREIRGQEANKENSSPEKLFNGKGSGNDNLTRNSTFDAAFINSRQGQVHNAVNRSPLSLNKTEANIMSTSDDQNTPSEICLQESLSLIENNDPLKINTPKLQNDRNGSISSKLCSDDHLRDSKAGYCESAPTTCCTPPRQSLPTTADGSEDQSCYPQDTRRQKVHGTPLKSLQSGAGAPPTKVHFETSL